MKTFKDILKNKFRTFDKSALEIDNMNLDAASASSLHIEKLKSIFRSKLNDFNIILNLNHKENISTFRYNEAINWVNELYPKINAVINIGNDINNLINIHNKLFPNEKIDELTEEEKNILKELQI